MKIFLLLCVACLVSSIDVSDGADVCPYNKCDSGAAKCFEVNGEVRTIKVCPSGQYCNADKCTPNPTPPDPACQIPGYKPITNQKCCGGDLKDGAYCKGLAKDATCTATGDKCDVGLFCDGAKCVPQLAKGADCPAGMGCQSNQFCVGGKCVDYFSIEDGKDNLLMETLCKSGHTFGGKCQKAVAMKTDVWSPPSKMGIECEFEDHKEPSLCVPTSGEATKTVYCKKYDAAFTQADFKSYLAAYKENSCTIMDMWCEKNSDVYTCLKSRAAAKNSMFFQADMESLNPSCIPSATDALLGLRFKCFGSELVWGILSVLAIVLLI